MIGSPTTDESSSPLDVSTNSITTTKLLQGVEKSYDKGKKIADKNWILTAYNENAGDNTSAISGVNQDHAAPTPDVSTNKGNKKTIRAKFKYKNAE